MRGCVIASLVVASSLAQAAPSRQEVEHALAGIEHAGSVDELRRLGDGTDRVLAEIARDPSVSRLRRNRALSALSAIPSAEGLAVLRETLQARATAERGVDLLDLLACIRALASFGRDAEIVAPLADHPSSDVRAAVKTTLARARHGRAHPPN